MTERLAMTLATWFYSGYVPAAPGTAGSVVAWAMAWLVVHRLGAPAWALGIAALALIPVAVKTSEFAATRLGSHDPSVVVIDEVVGQWIALSAAASGSWPQWIAALVLFRALDIAKPLGIRRLEALAGGKGVVADDIGAGACAMIGVAAIRWLGF